ncbi:hypothetical protein VZT92_005493 [Zoarces viviparus]|uniref:Uncharacterized protein n=1 Tax=Zoarces viviparus TaxID=48416 RepID=A0AAW1FUN9_ZOAVI
MAAALKEAQDLLETERDFQSKTTTEEEMEVFKNLCQAKVDEQLDVSSKLKAALEKAEQELKNGHLQWQEEKSSLTARQYNNCYSFHSQGKVIASIRAQEREAAKQTLEKTQAFYQAQLEEQRAERSKMAAALKEAQDLLETEHEEMEVFKNLYQEKLDEQLDVSSKLKAALEKAEPELKNGHLQWQEEKSSLKARQQKNSDSFHSQGKVIASIRAQEREAAKQTLEKNQAFYQAQLEEQRAESSKMAAVLKEAQDLLETERDVQSKTTTEEEMEVFKNLCQAKVDEQLDVSSKLKAALEKAEQELKNGHLQWQEEKSSLKARQQKNSDSFHSQGKVIASIRAQEREAAKQTLEKSQAFYQAQLEEQRAESSKMAAALKEAQDLLETERDVQSKTTTEEEMEVFKNLCQAKVDEQLDVSSKLKAALEKAKQELKNGHLQWQEEKSSLKARQYNNCYSFHSQGKVIASIRAQEREAAKQTLEKNQAFYQAQLEEQRAEHSKMAAALKEAQDLLETEHEEMEVFKNLYQEKVDEQLDVSSKLKAALEKAEQELKNGHLQWQEEKSSLKARQQKNSDSFHSQGKVIASIRAQEREAAKQTLEKSQAFYQAQLEEQRAESSKMAAALKEAQDLLETERDVQSKTTTEEEMEVFKNLCQAKVDEQLDVSSRLKAALEKAKQELKNGHLQWQEEKSSLKARQYNNCYSFHSPGKVIASIRAQEREAAKQTLEKTQAFYQAQLEEQRAEHSKMAAALKEAQDLLETEHEEMEVFKNLYQEKVDEQLDVSSKLKAALEKAEQELKNGHLQWQEEKSFLKARQQNNCDSFHSQGKVIASIRAQEREAAKQTLEKSQAFYQAQLEEQRAESSKMAAALKEAQDLLETERGDWVRPLASERVNLRGFRQ